MITVINYYNSLMGGNSLLIKEMFKARSKIFTERLGWTQSVGCYEIDQFDTFLADPIYIISHSDGKYQGSLRLLKTTNINMLADVFSDLLPSDKIPNDPSILESSRIHVVSKNFSRKKSDFLNSALGELSFGMANYAYHNDVRKIVTVVDKNMLRLMKMTSLELDVIGERVVKELTIDNIFFYVLLFDVEKNYINMKKE